jgi:hypothetical protein
VTDDTEVTGTALVLRTCAADGSSHGGFRWPLEVGVTVEAPDWDPKPSCGNGLHGLLWGEGDGGLLDWADDAVWLVVAVTEWVDIDGKVKFPRCKVAHVGDRHTASSYIMAHGGAGRAVAAGTASAGYRGTASAGDWGTLLGKWRDGSRYRIAVAYVGEDGIKANTPYRVNDRGEWVEVCDG